MSKLSLTMAALVVVASCIYSFGGYHLGIYGLAIVAVATAALLLGGRQ